MMSYNMATTCIWPRQLQWVYTWRQISPFTNSCRTKLWLLRQCFEVVTGFNVIMKAFLAKATAALLTRRWHWRQAVYQRLYASKEYTCRLEQRPNYNRGPPFGKTCFHCKQRFQLMLSNTVDMHLYNRPSFDLRNNPFPNWYTLT